MSTNASARNIAECLSQKTGKEYNRQDVHNLMKKIVDDKETITAEAVLGNLKDNGGNVLYSRDDSSCVDVLFFQTKDMIDLLKKEESLSISE